MLNLFRKSEELKKTWTIVLLKTSENWYVDYMNNKLTYQIESNDLKDLINISILNDIWEIEDNINSYGDYINIIEDGEISDNYVPILYKAIKKCKKDAITFSGIFKKDNEEFVFNQIEETDEEIFLQISQMNPIKKEIISENILEYLHDRLISLTICNINEVLVFRDHEVKHEELILEEEITKEPFSIILTAYQTENFIEQSLDSIENQTYFKNYDEYEVLVGVDGCEDTLQKLNEIKHKYRNLSVYMMTENCGTYMTTNALLNLVRYENVIRFDSDDVMEPIMIEEISKFKSEDDDIIKLGFSDWIESGQVSEYSFANDGIIYFKKKVMDEIAGGYQPWICAADSELLARLKNRVKINELNKRLFLRRIHDNSLTKRRDTGFGSMVRRNYQKQIKSHYNEDEVKIERISNTLETKTINSNEEFKKSSFYFDDIDRVLVMIPAYNAEITIEKSIISVLNQTHKNIKLVLIDDCSTDGTLKVMLKFKDLKNVSIFHLEKNIGTYQAMNYALYHIDYFDYFIGHGADDIMIENSIELYIKTIKNSKNYLASIGGYERYNFDTNEIIHKSKQGHSMILYTREVFTKLGYFDNTRYGGDTEYVSRFLAYFGNDKLGSIGETLTRAYTMNNGTNLTTRISSEIRNKYVHKIEQELIEMKNKKNFFRKAFEDSFVTVNVVSIPEREYSLKETVYSLINQCDLMNVYLNGFDKIPDFLNHNKIKVWLSQNYGDRGDGGKFFKASETNGYFLTVDDDIIYPSNYVNTLISKVEFYNRKYLVTCHGRVLKDGYLQSYYSPDSRVVLYHCMKDVENDNPVHVGGTGVMCFHSSTINVKYEDFKEPNMADVWMFALTQKQKVGIICIAHQKDWLLASKYVKNEDTIWYKHNKNDKIQTEIVNQFPKRIFFI